MHLEHVALMVNDPPVVAAWYVEHLGLELVRHMTAPPHTHFLAAGGVMIEIYNNPIARVPDYPTVHPLELHLAFSVDDIVRECDRLQVAGATVAMPLDTTPDGDRIVMLRDPWGLPIQLVRRRTPLI